VLARLDELIRAGVAHTEQALPERKSFKEELLEKALIEGVQKVEPQVRGEQTGHGRKLVPYWDRELGDFDVKFWLPGEALPSILAEAKVDDIGQTLWDLFKLTSIPEINGAIAGYLVVAAPRKAWERGGDCVGLYEPGAEPKQWDTEKCFIEWSKAWSDLTGPRGGAARPLSCPSQFRTTFIASAPVAAFPPYEIRCIRVEPDGVERIVFVDGETPSFS
jgi:hypothetical protein